MRSASRIALLVVLASVVSASFAGATPIKFHGLLDLTAPTRGDALTSNWDGPMVSPFDLYKLRVMAEATPTSNLEVDVQALYSENERLRLIGAYVQYTPWAERDLHLAAGKIPWYIGTYAPRAYSDKNPLVGTPLLYQFSTGLGWFALPASMDDLLGRTNGGDPSVGSEYYGGGMPVIWQSWWDAGIVAIGSARPFEGAFGVVAGAPGWATAGEEENSGKTWLGRLGLTPHPAVRIGISGAIGPYLNDFSNRFVPPGKTVNDYDQALAMVDAEIQSGHAELRGEGFRNVWETPNLGNLRVSGYYVEGKYTLAAGLYAAGRWDELRFSKVADSGGAVQPWHPDVDRLELGLGYRLSRGVLGKLVYQRFTHHAPTPAESGESSGLAAAQLTVSF
ncbi:MAG: hypothetical protein ABI960_03320 [Candidatus Eisenbacteria bacterium]